MLKPFIISEIGSNHDGNFDKLIELIKISKKIGADAVKFQLFKAEDLGISKEKTKKEIDNISFKTSWIKKIDQFCKKLKIELIFSFFSLESLNIIQKNLRCNYIKIASSELNNYNLISKINPNIKNVILSIGMSVESEIIKAKEILNMNSNSKIIAMHCVSDYPTKDIDLNLAYVNKLKSLDFDFVGLSDHTLDDIASITCVGMGAMFFEKHLTLDKSAKGPDHFYALNPDEFKRYIGNIRRSFTMIGKNKRIISKKEKQFGRRLGIHTKRFMKKGEIISKNDIHYKSPSVGIRDIYLENVLDKKINKNLSKNHPIQIKDIS